ncbi:hypothetical protein KUCAC02_004651 [Chaenocephalus aceratus]|uniref:Uncharacterized protein n=1 Tax=Chaenocephalus aceratus TaxID=36190 RepID=A0ACB9X003_CHAAC|nr:hypothetical protein KUCAC02_004651 [Chaenocephalus aceratus]
MIMEVRVLKEIMLQFYPRSSQGVGAGGPPAERPPGSHHEAALPRGGDPPPLIMWTKDGRNIHSGWTRFRVLQHGLRIKEVEPEDAGTYICKATNGFGSVNINYTLIVIGKWKTM